MSRIYALFFIAVGWLIFYHTDVSAGVRCLGAMFGIGADSFASATDLYDLLRYLPTFAICAVASTPIPKKLFERLHEKYSAFRWAVPAMMLAVLFVAVAYIVSSTFSPFLYYIF